MKIRVSGGIFCGYPYFLVYGNGMIFHSRQVLDRIWESEDNRQKEKKQRMMSRHVFAFLPKYHPGAVDGFSGSWRRDRRIWSVYLCDKRSGDLHVSEDRVCFSGLQWSPISFYIDYLAMMGLFIRTAYYLSMFLQKFLLPERNRT